jgi:hypothetical protein
MSASAAPYISFIIAARNDQYAGGIVRRLQVCVDTFVHQAEALGLPAELIIVDWNPPPDKDLARAVRWPTRRQSCSIRIITVPPHIHARQPFADSLPILIHRARNVGIRRALGQFVLPTSADILLSDELAAEIALRQLDACALYRIARHDVPIAALDVGSHEARLEYCRANVLQLHDGTSSYRIPGAPSLFTNAAGDFTLLSRELYFRLRGVPQEREYHSMHWDSVFCYMAYAACGKEIVFSDPCRIYHVDHGTASWKPKARIIEKLAARLPLGARRSKRLVKAVRARWPPRSRMDRLGVPYLNLMVPPGREQFEKLILNVVEGRGAFLYNEAQWGLGDETLEEQIVS